MGDIPAQLCLKQGGKCAVFVPQLDQLELWVKLLKNQYVERLNSSEQYSGDHVTTTSGESDEVAQDKFQVYDKINKNK